MCLDFTSTDDLNASWILCKDFSMVESLKGKGGGIPMKNVEE